MTKFPCGEKLEIHRLPLDRQGYTKQGQYFGVGAPLWTVWSENKETVVRAPTKKAARLTVQGPCPRKRARK